MRTPSSTYLILILPLILVYACGDASRYAPSNAAATRISLAVLGDSVSSGVMAQTKYGNRDDFERAFGGLAASGSKNFYDVKKLEHDFSATSKSYSQTTADWGLRSRLAKHHETRDVADAFVSAKWGRHMSAADVALKELEGVYRDRNQDPNTVDYVLLSFGPNDFCRGDSPDKFRESTKKAIDLVLARHAKAKVIIPSQPHLTQLTISGNATYRRTASIKVAGKKIEKNIYSVDCNSMRKNYCKRMYEKDAAARLEAMNRALSDAIADQNSKTPERVIGVPQMEQLELKTEFQSVDCFHPSEAGHQEIARTIGDSL